MTSIRSTTRAQRIATHFSDFTTSPRAGGIILILCTLASLALANSPVGAAYLALWHVQAAGLSLELWINDALMAIFFLLVGLELKREIQSGELSDIRSALLPMLGAAGGIAVPALLHFAFNHGTATQPGMGIPMATDIAFALGVLALLGNRVPVALKIFLTALAVMDDLGAIVVIAVFYTAQMSFAYLAGALAVFCALLVMRRVLRVAAMLPYLLGGALMWFLMLQSGVHATIAGVLLAFAVPQAGSERLEHALHKPVTFLILPLFALANTGILVGAGWAAALLLPNSLGIFLGLVAGKPAGIFLFSLAAVAMGLCRLPAGLAWRHLFGAGLLGGIGFTMSIFVTNLAFAGQADVINASKLAILLASLVAGILGFAWLASTGARTPAPPV